MGLGDGLIRMGTGLFRLGWAITKGTFALLLWGALIAGCVSLFL